MPPTISIVTATYNRSNVLRLTIDSVLAQSWTDWELIVVGDACTDDTETVVRSFGDERIRFVNLPVNAGEQSVPNNEGVRLARGEHIAFLNHDDLWTPDHLTVALQALRTGAELVATLTIVLDHHGLAHLQGACASNILGPEATVPASSWLFRRELFDAVGPWRSARELFVTPSQDWLFRAWKRGHRLRSVPKATVIAVTSGGRRQSYANRDVAENAAVAARLRNDPHFVEELLTTIASRHSVDATRFSVAPHLFRALKNVARRAAVAAGIHPAALLRAVTHRRRGGYINALRRTRGLPPLPARGGSGA